MRALLVLLVAAGLYGAAPPSLAAASPAALTIPAHGVIGVEERQLNADYWIQRQARADRVVLDAKAIGEQNARLRELDPSVHDLEGLPATVSRQQIRDWIASVSERPPQALYDDRGQSIAAQVLDGLQTALNLDAIPQQQALRYGLIVHRADLRAFPTPLRVFNSPDDHDIDRFQESGLFPGDPVAITHESRDRQWWFVVSPLYTAWIEKRYVAEGEAAAVFGYGRRTPQLIVTGATARTVYTPEQPKLSQLQLDMGVRVPLLADWPADRPVNGQHPYTAHVIELPLRGDDGRLSFAPALLPKTQDTTAQYLPLTKANLLRQGFKFLGERYGWGHSYNARDCSGFVSDVYRSFGVTLPRNTRDQAVSPALNRIAFSEQDDRAARMKVVRELQVGDLIYIPGHVMMVIGDRDGEPYVIHDTTGISYRDGEGRMARAHLNGVSVSPLTPLLFDEAHSYVDRITSIQRIRP
ncbi:SH3 domain-containing protein [Lysobacter sp. Root604]|uniref:C40 family peptidase n=1 Tax=Lysobacter sp. Root604 TaxID=1736568 RepID=UPI0006F33806|nr:SH3 domain-containing protein [Lysobacter sp. Root604]KRA15266.1 NlpC-P60 family protein [Lysobacter sp. Root604]